MSRGDGSLRNRAGAAWDTSAKTVQRALIVHAVDVDAINDIALTVGAVFERLAIERIPRHGRKKLRHQRIKRFEDRGFGIRDSG